MLERCLQINLQPGFGGGEVYTAALARALRAAGVASALCVAPQSPAWRRLALGGTQVRPLARIEDLPERLRGEAPCWLAFHTYAPAATLEALRARGHLLTAFAHMPLSGRDPRPLRPFDLVIGVSRYVVATLRAAGIEHVYPEPLYGTAELDRLGPAPTDAALRARSRYDWDRRKLRDRVLGALEPLLAPFTARPRYQRRPGLTLGIVSRLTPIKQFPLLAASVGEVLARLPVNLEIFGSGGYASVRALARALAPLGDRVRFWGYQDDVAQVYRAVDFLLTGLPEKEALGLNVLEAQACGTPVLAPDAPPFDETVLDGVTGLRYRDPRADGGADFERVLQRILEHGFRFDAAAAQSHLARFTEDALAERLRALRAYLAARR